MPKPPNIPSPDAIRSKLKRLAAKQNATSLAHKIKITYSNLWNFITEHTTELKHLNLTKYLKHLIINKTKTP